MTKQSWKTLPGLRTGRKWKVSCTVDSAQEALKLKEAVGYAQTDRQGFDQKQCPMVVKVQPESAEKWWFRRSMEQTMEIF